MKAWVDWWLTQEVTFQKIQQWSNEETEWAMLLLTISPYTNHVNYSCSPSFHPSWKGAAPPTIPVPPPSQERWHTSHSRRHLLPGKTPSLHKNLEIWAGALLGLRKLLLSQLRVLFTNLPLMMSYRNDCLPGPRPGWSLVSLIATTRLADVGCSLLLLKECSSHEIKNIRSKWWQHCDSDLRVSPHQTEDNLRSWANRNASHVEYLNSSIP